MCHDRAGLAPALRVAPARALPAAPCEQDNAREARDEAGGAQAFLDAYFEGHFVTNVSGFATKTPFAYRPLTTTSRPSLNWSGTLPR
jgi:hypothetical protein